MSKKWSRLISVAAVAAMMVSLMAGCGSAKNVQTTGDTSAKPAETTAASTAAETQKSLEPITFTIFCKNNDSDKFDTDVAKEVTKRTGVTLQYFPASGDPKEKLNLMLASNDLPDLVEIDRGSDAMNKYIASQAVIPLDDLIAKYGPNIVKEYGDTLKKTRYSDGKNYFLADWFSSIANEPVFGFLMRKDYLKQLDVGDKVENGGYFTDEEFINILKSFKDKFPQINGHKTLPMTIWQENFSGALYTFMGMYGLKSYTEVNGELKSNIRDPKYLDMLKFMNRLYREGLLDPEWPANKQALWNQKLSSGYVLCTPDAYWNPGTADTELKKTSLDSEFYPYKVVAPGVDPAKTTYGPSSVLGWDGVMITKANKNPERAMQFLDFCASEEGQYLFQWGIEGVHWDMADGKHKPKPETLDGFKKDWAGFVNKTGIRKYALTFKGGVGSDGTPFDLAVRYERDEIGQHAMKYLGDSTYDTSVYDDLGPTAGTPEALTATKIDDISKSMLPKIVLAKTEAEAVSLFNKMVGDMDAAGLAQIEKIRNENYQKRLELWK